jgi:hypothetical protein
MRDHGSQTRDAALRRLGRANRWLIAGSVTLTGVLAEVAAQAFPGKSVHSPATGQVRRLGLGEGARRRTAPARTGAPTGA